MKFVRTICEITKEVAFKKRLALNEYLVRDRLNSEMDMEVPNWNELKRFAKKPGVLVHSGITQ